MKTVLLPATLALAALSVGGASLAAPQSPVPAPAANGSCWRSIDFDQFHPVDDHSFYMRTKSNRVFLITTTQCPNLVGPQPRLDTVVRGSDLICGPVDWDLRVAQGSGPGGFSEPCIVQSQRELTPAEAAAIPRNLRP